MQQQQVEANQRVRYTEEFATDSLAQAYENHVYASDSHSSLLWELERLQLDEFLNRFTVGRRHLDFACGTGRVAGHLTGRFDVTAVDISQAMVNVAKTVRPGPDYLAGNILNDAFFADLRALGPFDSISAFRFILNADRDIVGPILARLSDLLAPTGVAIINNHGDTRSIKALPRTLKALRRKSNESAVGNYLTPKAAERLFAQAGLWVADAAGTGVLPGKALPYMGFTRLEAAERLLLNSPVSGFGTNTMYALRSR